MQMGLIGLGKMGGNMRDRLKAAGHDIVGYDRDLTKADVGSLEEAVGALDGEERRIVWVMIPAGEPTKATIDDTREGMIASDSMSSR